MSSDTAILDALRRALDLVDGADTTLIEVAEAAYAWRDIDAELAQLVYDSDAPGAEPAVRTRGPAESRTLTFTNQAVTLEIEVAGDRLLGQVVPPVPCTVTVQRAVGEPTTAGADTSGAFVLDGLEPGPIAVMCAAVDEAWRIRTAWTIV